MGKSASIQLRIAFATFSAALLGQLVLAPTASSARRDEPGTASVQSDNFVVSAPDMATAKLVLARAESLRLSLAQQLLGEKLPDGIAPAIIRVTLTNEEDKGITWVADRADRLSHMMWLNTSLQRATGSTLAHEMTHVVLATRFPGKLPAWVDEGLASRQDDTERVKARQEILAWYAKTGNWPSLTEIFAAGQIYSGDRAKYAMSASLTEYLLSINNSAKLFEFTQSGQEQGWDVALREHYGITNTRELETRWRAWVSR